MASREVKDIKEPSDPSIRVPTPSYSIAETTPLTYPTEEPIVIAHTDLMVFVRPSLPIPMEETSSNRGKRYTTNLMSAPIDRNKLTHGGGILQDVFEGTVPDIAELKISVFPRVSVADKEEMMKLHLIIKFVGDAFMNLRHKLKYFCMTVNTSIRDTENHLVLVAEEYSYSIHNIDETGVRVFAIDVDSSDNIKELMTETITIDCEVVFLPMSCS